MFHKLVLGALLALGLEGAPLGRDGGAVATLAVSNDAPSASAAQVVTFGQMFRPGDVRPGDGLAAAVGQGEAPAQLDPQSRWPDGSIKHAVVSLQVPPLKGGAGMKVRLLRGAAPSGGSAASPAPDLVVEIRWREGPGAGRIARVALRELVQASPADDRPWLNGALVSERRYWSPPLDGIQLAFDVRTPAAGPPRVDLIVHNDLAQDPAIGLRAYDLRATLDGREVLRADGVAHHAYAVWRRTIYADGRPPLRITPDTGRLIELGATPDYIRLSPDGEAMAALHKAAIANPAPLSPAGVTPYMPTGGGRADIGPLPTWAVFYLLDPSAMNEETLLANAEAAGAIPWHLRDGRTNGPPDLQAAAKVWLDGRGEAQPPLMARAYEQPQTPWQPDTAHQPSLTYLPYLITGDRFYRDELASEANYSILSMNPQYRGGAKGLVVGDQVRSVAWTLRTLATAAYALPDDDPLKAGFRAAVEANLDEILRRFVAPGMSESGEIQGFLPGPYAVDGATAPWQSDYLAMTLGWLHRMGFSQARPILAWMDNFTSGRFTSAARGYDPLYGTPYFLFVNDPKTQRRYVTWAEAFRATFDPAKPVKSLESPDSAGGYAALARGALASIYNATGSSHALAAYAYVKAQTPKMDASYATGPSFAIAMHAPEGR